MAVEPVLDEELNHRRRLVVLFKRREAASQEELGDGQKHKLQTGDIAAHSPDEVLMAWEALEEGEHERPPGSLGLASRFAACDDLILEDVKDDGGTRGQEVEKNRPEEVATISAPSRRVGGAR